MINPVEQHNGTPVVILAYRPKSGIKRINKLTFSYCQYLALISY